MLSLIESNDEELSSKSKNDEKLKILSEEENIILSEDLVNNLKEEKITPKMIQIHPIEDSSSVAASAPVAAAPSAEAPSALASTSFTGRRQSDDWYYYFI